MNASRFVIHVSLAIAFATGARAQATTEAAQPAASAAAGTMIDGEVRKVDKEAGKITLRHGPIAHWTARHEHGVPSDRPEDARPGQVSDKVALWPTR